MCYLHVLFFRQGLNELYDFTQLYPDVDLSSYLTNTSQFFQAYIKQALRNIAVERARQARLSANDKEPNTLAAHQVSTSVTFFS